MPAYDYECRKCNYSEEIFQKMSDEPLTKCPKCKKKQFRRIITQITAFVKDAKTLIQLAEKNTKKMGKYHLEDKIEENRLNKQKCKEYVKKDKNNFFTKMDPKVRKKVMKSPQSKKKYILEGKVD